MFPQDVNLLPFRLHFILNKFGRLVINVGERLPALHSDPGGVRHRPNDRPGRSRPPTRPADAVPGQFADGVQVAVEFQSLGNRCIIHFACFKPFSFDELIQPQARFGIAGKRLRYLTDAVLPGEGGEFEFHLEPIARVAGMTEVSFEQHGAGSRDWPINAIVAAAG